MKNYDQVYVNGKFFTSDEKKLYADAMAVKDGLIAWIGEAAELDTADEEVVDLQGKRVLPGIIDSHMHPVMLAANQRQIVCLPPYINSIEELIEAIKKARTAQGPKTWIFGWGYDEGKLKEGKTPSRYDLDAGADDVPVCILRSCGHMRCINSKALEMAGINRDTPDPEGGEIMKDDQGEPTGVLRENARFLLSDILPKDSEDAVIDNLVMLSEHLLSQGITAVGDMGNLDDTDYYYVYQKARERGFLQRVSVFYMWESFKNISDFQFKPEQLDRKAPVKVSGLKIIASSIGYFIESVKKPAVVRFRNNPPVYERGELIRFAFLNSTVLIVGIAAVAEKKFHIFSVVPIELSASRGSDGYRVGEQVFWHTQRPA